MADDAPVALLDQQHVRNPARDAPSDRRLGRKRAPARDEHAVWPQEVEGMPDGPCDRVLASDDPIEHCNARAAGEPVDVTWNFHGSSACDRDRRGIDDVKIDVFIFRERVEEGGRLLARLREDSE